MRSLAGVRSRWAAIGAACAVALGAGGFGVVNAVVSSGEKSVFVPVSPIRVLDTRDSAEITDGTRRLVVEGAITVADGSSQLVVPASASAVAVNITATSTRKNGGYGFVTVFPCVADSDAVPNASSLNFENGVDIANALNVSTSANGSICLYVYGTADLIVDVAGYFVDHDHDDRYYTEAEVDTALAARATSRDWMPIPAGSTPVTVDTPGLGYSTSIAIGANGLPIISYQDNSNNDLRVAACVDVACSSASKTTVDATGNTGFYSSIAIGTNGLPVISYFDASNGALRVAACADVVCSSATKTTVDAPGLAGWFTSIAIGRNGFPVISYFDYLNGDLRVAACADVACSTPVTPNIVDSTGNTGQYTSIAIGVNGFPVISYFDVTNGDLRVAACADVVCSSATKTTVDATGSTGQYTSIAIGANGFPVISYFDVTNADLRVAACADVVCSSATKTTLDTAGVIGWETSITIGTNGLPIISYYDFSNGDLRTATCSTTTCSSWTSSAVDSIGFTGRETSIAIGTNGFPTISYYDSTNGYLRVAVPWWTVGGR